MGVLLALVALPQEMTADETFRKIAETVEKAKTVAVVFRHEAVKRGDDTKITGGGELLLKEGNKCLFRFRKKVPGEGEADTSVISDGTTLQIRVNGILMREAATRDVLNRRFSMYLTRSGLFLYQLLPTLFPGVRRGGPVESLEASDAAHGEEEGGARSIRYALKVPGQEGPAVQITLFYEAATFKPLKRVVTIVEMTITETYENFTCDSDIPDAKFELPKDK